MKRHIIFDTTNGNIDSVITWGDDRDFPEDHPLYSNQAVKTITDDSVQVDGVSYCYNIADDTFHKKLKISTDVVQINHLDGIANIAVDYLNTAINEICKLTIDGQTVDINVVNGKASIPFSSQVLGWHNISIASSTSFGKDSINIEVI